MLSAIDHSTHFSKQHNVSDLKNSGRVRNVGLRLAELLDFKLLGTVAAGDGIVFWMQIPTAEEVDGDVTSYFTHKGYYAHGLQAYLTLSVVS